MRISHDAEVDAAYVHLKEEIDAGEAYQNDLIDIEDLEADVVLDLDMHGHFLGIEIIGASVLLSAEAIDLAEEISNPLGGDAKRHRFPIYLDAATDVLRAPLSHNAQAPGLRVVRLPPPTEGAGWVELHLDDQGHLLRIEIGHATGFVHPDALTGAIR